MKKRLKYIDIARGMAMFLIVLTHTLAVAGHCSQIYKLLFFFNVPLFFILSGMTFRVKEDESFWKFLKDKFIRTMLPYFVWAGLFLIPYFIFGREVSTELSREASFDLLGMIGNIFYGNGAHDALKQNAPLWFLPAFFSTEIIYYFLIKLLGKAKERKRAEILMLLGVLLVGFLCTTFTSKFYLPWGLNSALTIGVFFYVGYLMKEFKVFEGRGKKFDFILTAICLLIGGFIFAIWEGGNVIWADYEYGNYGLCLLAGVSFSIVIIQLARLIKENRVIEYVGRNTMNILIFHKVFVVIFQTKLGGFSALLKNSNLGLEMLLAILVSVVAVTASLLVGKILRRGRA